MTSTPGGRWRIASARSKQLSASTTNEHGYLGVLKGNVALREDTTSACRPVDARVPDTHGRGGPVPVASDAAAAGRDVRLWRHGGPPGRALA